MIVITCDPVIPHEPGQVQPAPFSNRIPRRPAPRYRIIVTVPVKEQTRCCFRRGRIDFPAWLWGLEAICRVQFVRLRKKSPDAVFRGGVYFFLARICGGVAYWISVKRSGFGQLKEGCFSPVTQVFSGPLAAGWVRSRLPARRPP